MRTALRTATAVALLAGVALTAPALTAGAAFAADGPAAVATAGANPSARPSGQPSAQPSAAPTTGASARPAAQPSGQPSAAPTAKASSVPSSAPTEKAGAPVVIGACTVQQVIDSVYPFPGMTVTLTNDLKTGPKAVLRDGDEIVATVDREHRVNGTSGLVIDRALTVRPQFGQRTQGGAPYTWTSFPELPKGCASFETPGPGPVERTGECTVTQVVPSVFGLGWSVTLTNDLRKGPKAVLVDDNGEVAGTADRAHPLDGHVGVTVKGANTLTPVLGQRTQGGDTPFRWTAFPKLPKGCGEDTAGTTTGAGDTDTTTHTGQTSVIPKGGVAAGAEFAPADDSTTLIAAGAGAAAVTAAGLGFVALRRRGARV
ncbi:MULTISPECIES: PT domain-containing protein [unclassified Streptomyces]|uniref:PT domain-containing protein n=1 Tax=unclassified Streptomyces TaxID=2593676 RepID=UPI0007012AE4|nr:MULTISPECIES: PT domain-containing protein [unclassified Streptomyces]KQX58993.1 hypothetical protein ASD33_01410 [Streptomyces sp. Root1304]KRB00254.1 hypothetical protein ASE09_01410 [Streptomyces sp. Root66D1]